MVDERVGLTAAWKVGQMAGSSVASMGAKRAAQWAAATVVPKAGCWAALTVAHLVDKRPDWKAVVRADLMAEHWVEETETCSAENKAAGRVELWEKSSVDTKAACWVADWVLRKVVCLVESTAEN